MKQILCVIKKIYNLCMFLYYVSKTFWKNREWEVYPAMLAPLHLLIIIRETKTGTHKPIQVSSPLCLVIYYGSTQLLYGKMPLYTLY